MISLVLVLAHFYVPNPQSLTIRPTLACLVVKSPQSSAAHDSIVSVGSIPSLFMAVVSKTHLNQ